MYFDIWTIWLRSLPLGGFRIEGRPLKVKRKWPVLFFPLANYIFVFECFVRVVGLEILIKFERTALGNERSD